MNCVLNPSLEHRTLTRIAITLWNRDDVRALTTSFLVQSSICSDLDVNSNIYDDSKRRKAWQVVEDRVIKKVTGLLLPEALKKKILNFINAIGMEILNWRQYHDQYFQLGRELPHELCWTPEGTVDKKKTAEVFIKNENLDITSRYKLACVYCLEEDIPKLWDKIPENIREEFYSDESPRKVRQQHLVIIWTCDIKGEVAEVDNRIKEMHGSKCSPYQYAFEYAACGGNEVAAEYFLKKLTSTEREESLVKSAREVASRCDFSLDKFPLYFPNVLCFLLSQMDKEQLMEILKTHSFEVLECFLDWPWQSLFMAMANHVWGFLYELYYYFLLSAIIERVIKRYKDWDYQNLFAEFWQQSPETYKKYVTDRWVSNGYLLSQLFEIEDKQNVKLILKTATVKEREKIIFSVEGKNVCERLVYSNKWDSLKLFIQECTLSKEVMIKFKEEFKEHVTCNRLQQYTKNKYELKKHTLYQEYASYKWDKFFQLLDDLIQENNKKRSVEEGNSSTAKRFYSTELNMSRNQ